MKKDDYKRIFNHMEPDAGMKSRLRNKMHPGRERWYRHRLLAPAAICVMLLVMISAGVYQLTYGARGDTPRSAGIGVTNTAASLQAENREIIIKFASETYNPITSKLPGFGFSATCDGADRIDVSTVRGELAVWTNVQAEAQSMGKAYSAKPTEMMYWRSLVYTKDETLAETIQSVLSFTAYRGDQVLGTRKVMIMRNEGTFLYTYKLVDKDVEDIVINIWNPESIITGNPILLTTCTPSSDGTVKPGSWRKSTPYIDETADPLYGSTLTYARTEDSKLVIKSTMGSYTPEMSSVPGFPFFAVCKDADRIVMQTDQGQFLLWSNSTIQMMGGEYSADPNEMVYWSVFSTDDATAEAAAKAVLTFTAYRGSKVLGTLKVVIQREENSFVYTAEFQP